MEEIIDPIAYAVHYELIAEPSKIDDFRYGCHKGKRAVKEYIKHVNMQKFPRMMPLHTVHNFDEFLTKMANHAFDGENVDDLVKSTVSMLGQRKQLYDSIMMLANRRRVLDTSQMFTLPAFTEKAVSIPTSELMRISMMLSSQRPLKRADVEKALKATNVNSIYDIDEVISGLVAYSLL